MADTKISALPASTTPLAGTEVLPIVQGGATRQVTVANLTTGRALSATQLTLTTGNLIVASSQGIDFSATPGTGTSELFNDYEEGTWTPTLTASTSGTITTNAVGKYTKIGRTVLLTGYINVSAISSPVGDLVLNGFPFTVGAESAAGSLQPYGFANNVTTTGMYMSVNAANTTATIRGFLLGAQVTGLAQNSQNGAGFQMSIIYNT